MATLVWFSLEAVHTWQHWFSLQRDVCTWQHCLHCHWFSLQGDVHTGQHWFSLKDTATPCFKELYRTRGKNSSHLKELYEVRGSYFCCLKVSYEARHSEVSTLSCLKELYGARFSHSFVLTGFVLNKLQPLFLT